MKRNKGFTLLETIIYIALFALLMAGVLPAVHDILASRTQIGEMSTVQNEQSFVLRKIDWALASIDPSQTYTPSVGSSATLSLTRYDGIQVMVRLHSGKVEFSENGGTSYLPITTDNVTVDSLSFAYVPSTGSGPAGISALITMDGLSASTTKYFRQ
jgi:prepilin-type N-terminal cleavage/methylation domain-containing protein